MKTEYIRIHHSYVCQTFKDSLEIYRSGNAFYIPVNRRALRVLLKATPDKWDGSKISKYKCLFLHVTYVLGGHVKRRIGKIKDEKSLLNMLKIVVKKFHKTTGNLYKVKG